MIKTLLTTLKQDKETFEVPKSVQDAIPIRRLWPDGIFQFGNKFSKTLRFSDINYAIASKEDKKMCIRDRQRGVEANRTKVGYGANLPSD